MFLSNPEQVLDIINSTDFSIFFFDPSQSFPSIKRAIIIEPNDKDSITTDDVRGLIRLSVTKPTAEQVFVIHHANKLTESAATACLKLLEETSEHTHIAFFITGDTPLLPTIKSRAQIYSLVKPLDHSRIDADDRLIADAKLLIGSRPSDLTALAAKYKSDREKALALAAAAIDLCYKSFIKTGNPQFLRLLSKTLSLDTALRQNGHVKIQLIANMI